jgi:hypothetical protein
VRAAACGTNAGMQRWAEALLLTSLTKGTVQLGMLSCLNITFSVGLQLLPFPFAVVGWLARRGESSAKVRWVQGKNQITEARRGFHHESSMQHLQSDVAVIFAR